MAKKSLDDVWSRRRPALPCARSCGIRQSSNLCHVPRQKHTANAVFPVAHCVVFTQHVNKLKGLVCVNVNGLNGRVGEYCIFYILS